jgi:hypothetical protein
MKKLGHIMVDIETMSDAPQGALLSIGAVEFNLSTGETGKEFYVNVDLQSCLDVGLTVTASTIMWWFQQSDEARNSITEAKGEPLYEALQSFSIFVKDCGGKDCEIWGNGPTFDISNLINSYHKIKLPIPWDFRKERCVRTLVSFAPIIKSMTKFYGVAHNALSDCYHQIKYCSDTFKKIEINNN